MLDSTEEDKNHIRKLWSRLNNALGPVDIPEASDTEIDAWESQRKKKLKEKYPDRNSSHFKFPPEYRDYLKVTSKVERYLDETAKVADPRQKDRICFSSFYGSFLQGFATSCSKTHGEVTAKSFLDPYWMMFTKEYSTFGMFFINCNSQDKEYGAIYRFQSNDSEVKKVFDSLADYLEFVEGYLNDVVQFNNFDNYFVLNYDKTKKIQKDIDTIVDDIWWILPIKGNKSARDIRDDMASKQKAIYVRANSQAQRLAQMSFETKDDNAMVLSTKDKEYPVKIDLDDKCVVIRNYFSGYAFETTLKEACDLWIATENGYFEIYIDLDKAKKKITKVIDLFLPREGDILVKNV